ncbi:unnamed protein product [Closterium sp. NIES-53]
MTSLRRSGGSGDDGGGSTGSGGGRPSNRYGAVRWGVSGGGQMRVHQRQHEALTPKQLREWYTSRDGGGGSSGGRSAAIQLGVTGRGLPKLQWRPRETLSPQQLQFGDATKLPRWLELVRQGVDIFTLDYDAILTAMYDLSASAEGDCSRCVTPDPSIAAAALGASESGTLPGTAPAQALHTFTLDSGASCCFFCDSTTLTPLLAPVPVRLADPSGGPVVAHSSTVLLCSAVLSGSLSGLHLPSFSTNLVSTAALKDAIVTTTTPGGRRVSICTCTRTGRDLATFTRRPGSSLYTLTTEPSLVATSAQVTAAGRVAASCSCRLLLHQTLLWHHHLGHPSLPCLRGMHYHLLVSGLPRFLPPLLPSPAPPCLPCVEGRQRAAPHPSSFPPTTAPLQTLHMDVLGPACLRERFGQDLPFMCLHSDRGGEISNLLQEFWCGEGILHSFTLPDSPQKNGIAERRIGLVMEVDRTSMIQAGAPHFLWPFAVWYAAHQLNLWPCVSLLETSPTLRWRREVGDASVFRVWSSRAFVRDTFADKLSTCAIPCVFLGFVPDARGWQFYNPTSCPALPSQDVTFDESVPFNRLFPYRTAPPPPPPLFLAPGPPPVDPLMPLGPAPSGVSQVDSLAGTAPVEVAVGSGAAPGAASGGAASGGAASGGATSGCAEPGGAEPGGEEPGGVEPEGVEPGGAESEGAESGGAEPRGAASSGGPAGASPLLSPQQLREWLVWRTRLKSGAPGAGGAGDAGAGGAGVTTGAGGTGGTAAASPGGARTRGAGAAGTGGSCAGGAGAGGAGARGAGVGVTGAGGAGAAGAGAVDSGARGAILKLPSQPASPLPAPSPYTEQSGGLTERRELASRRVSPIRTARRAPHSRPPPIPVTHTMTLCSSSVPLRVPLPAPPESSLPESIAASALVAELLDFAAACRLDYATALVVDSTSASPPSVGGECALGTDVLEDRQEDFECLASAVPRFASMLLAPEGDPDALDIPTTRTYVEAIMGPYSSQWQAAMDAEMASWKSTGTYVNEVPPPGANIVDGMWIFRVKRPPGSPPAFNARYVARGFSQRQGVDYFHTFFPTPKMTTLRVLLHVAAQRDYEIHSLDFSTAFLQGSLHEEIWLRRPLGFTEYFPAGTQWSLRRPVYGLRQVPREWHDTLRTTLVALAFAPGTADPSLRSCRRDTPALTWVLQRFGFQFSLPQLTPLSTGHSLLAPPSDESVEPNGLYPELVGCLMYLMTYTRPDLAYPLSLLAHYVAPGRDRKELRWLTYLLTNLGEQPCSPPVLYLDNKAMIALCQEHRLEHKTKHIALRYFLARELQQRGQLRLAYVATRANTADIFTKALPPAAMADPSPVGDGSESKPATKPVALTGLDFLRRPSAAPALTKADFPSMKCTICIEHGGVGTNFGAKGEGATDVQTQAMRKHQRTRKHRRAQRIEKTAAAALKANPRIDDNPKAKDLEKERLIALFESIAKSDAPIEIFVDLVRHLVQRGTPSWPNKRIWCLLHDVSKNSLVQIGAAYRRNSDIPTCAPERVANVSVAKDVGAASASVKRRSGKGKGGKGGGGGSGSSGGGSCGGGGGVGTAGGSGGSSGGGGGSSGSGGGGGSGTGTRRGGSGGGQRQQQQRQSETPSPQQLREWFLRGASGGSCPYVIRTGDRAGQTCGRSHTQHRFFSRLDDAWRAEFGDDVELPRWEDLLKSRIAIFDLDLDAIQSAMYALSFSAEGDCYRCVPPDPGIAAAALGASVSGNLLGTAPTEALHTFTLDSGASRSFFCDSTILTPLPTPVPVRLADPARGTSSGPLLHYPPVSGGSVRFTVRPSNPLVLYELGSSLYTLATEPSQVAASAQVSVPGQVSASCSCRLQSHQTLLWHHRLGHPFLPRLRGMHSRLLFSGLPTSLPPLTPSPAPPCLPCVEGRQRTAPHSSLFPPTIAPLQAFHMDVWGPARDVTFDESVPFYRLFPYGSAPPPPPPLFLTPGPLPVDPLPPQAVGSGAPRGAAPGGAASEGADPESAESEGAETAGAEPGGGEPGGSACASSRLSPQQLCEWFFWRTRLRSGASGAGGAGAAGAGGTGVAAGAGVTGGTTTTGPGGARTRGTGAAGTRGVEGAGAGDLTENGATCAGVAKAGGARVGGPSAGGAGVGGPSVGGAGAGAPGAVDPGGALRPRPYFVPLLQQVLGTPPSADLTPRLLCPPPDQSQPQLQPASPLSAPSPYTEQSGSLTEQRECESTTAYASYACLPLLYYAISSIG